MKSFRLSLCLCASVVSLLLAGCTSTHFERRPDGTIVLEANAFLVKRDLGRVSIDEKGASLESSKSDQMQAASDALALASAALKR